MSPNVDEARLSGRSGDDLQDEMQAASNSIKTDKSSSTMASGKQPEDMVPSSLPSSQDERATDSAVATSGEPHQPADQTTDKPSATTADSQEDMIDLGDNKPAATSVAPTAETGPKPDDAMATSPSATLKPSEPLPADTTTQYLTVESKSPYVDPTPATPTASGPPSRTTSSAGSRPDQSPTRSDAGYDERRYNSEGEEEGGGGRSEIQSIMEQFTGDGGGPGEDEVMSPRLEITSPVFGGPPMQHPPRNSSLEPLKPVLSQQHIQQDFQGLGLSTSSPISPPSHHQIDHGPPVPPKDAPAEPSSASQSLEDNQNQPNHGEGPMSPSSASAIHRPPPPEPEPEPALPFDFHRFLEQLRNKKADPVARYLKSFLSEFGKRQWMVHEQVKIIGDFLAFIANKMAQCEVWRDVSDAEFDNAREGMEKLVMNRLYSQTFSPAIAPPRPIPGAKPRRRGGEQPLGPGRRGQHQEDIERDDILAQKINIYGWIREDHLDIPKTGESGSRFLKLAQQELLKIKSYRAPRDKIICVLNCCKVIFGLLKHAKSDGSADSFMPLLIFVVLQANPDHLVSNVQYILRFRNQDKLGGEAGYYLSSLLGAIQFVENMDRTSLTITDEEFEKNVEAAVSAIAEKHQAESPPMEQLSEKVPSSLLPPVPGAGEASSSRQSRDNRGGGDPSMPRRSMSSDGEPEDGVAITGLLRTIQRPLNTIGRMFSDEPGPGEAPRTPQPQPQDRMYQRPMNQDEAAAAAAAGYAPHRTLPAEEAAARQASAEAAEAHRLQRAEHQNVVETLSAMFPDLDRDIISDVVHQKQGRVGLAVDACLALST